VVAPSRAGVVLDGEPVYFPARFKDRLGHPREEVRQPAAMESQLLLGRGVGALAVRGCRQVGIRRDGPDDDQPGVP
jgi:hypothetical protein